MGNDEKKILQDFDEGHLNSTATKHERARIEGAARATQIKDRRVDAHSAESKELRDLEK